MPEKQSNTKHKNPENPLEFSGFSVFWRRTLLSFVATLFDNVPLCFVRTITKRILHYLSALYRALRQRRILGFSTCDALDAHVPQLRNSSQ